MSKVLVVVYSLTGTSREVAKLLHSQQDWLVAEITAIHSRTGALGDMRCLFESMFRLRPPIHYAGPPPSDFDAVVLISPIWGFQLAAPMRSFVAMHRKQLPQVAVISVMGGSGASNAVAEIARILGRAPMLSTEFTSRAVENGSYAPLLQAFGSAVESATNTHDFVRPVSLSPQAV